MREELSEDERECSSRVLVMYCGSSRTPFANRVPSKGADAKGYVVECMRQSVLWLGHSRVTIRNNNEPALVQVVERAIAALKMSGVEPVVAEGSVPYDPQTNGAAESAGRLVKGMFKVLLLCLEREIKARTPHCPMAIQPRHHAQDIACERRRREDGAPARPWMRRPSTTLGVWRVMSLQVPGTGAALVAPNGALARESGLVWRDSPDSSCCRGY